MKKAIITNFILIMFTGLCLAEEDVQTLLNDLNQLTEDLKKQTKELEELTKESEDIKIPEVCRLPIYLSGARLSTPMGSGFRVINNEEEKKLIEQEIFKNSEAKEKVATIAKNIGSSAFLLKKTEGAAGGFSPTLLVTWVPATEELSGLSVEEKAEHAKMLLANEVITSLESHEDNFELLQSPKVSEGKPRAHCLTSAKTKYKDGSSQEIVKRTCIVLTKDKIFTITMIAKKGQDEETKNDLKKIFNSVEFNVF